MILIFILALNLLVLFHSSKGQISEDLVVTLNEPRSKIRGHVLRSFLGQDYYGFQEIPYAVPPLGENRFAEPKPHTGWQGILNTTSNKKECIQSGDFGDSGVSGTEDCLVINVYTPVRNSSAKLPVLFWIPGGAFQVGNGQYEFYNPQYYIDYGIIVVTINYRLGPLGFLTTEDGVIPANLGLKDQALALKWVNKNIDAFGGDPQKVTLTGESAGSISVSFHILSQKSKGLYRAGIMESGTALTHGTFVENARNYSFQLGRNIDKNFTSNDSKELLKLLRKASPEDIMYASTKVQKIENDIGIEPDMLWALVVEDKNYKNALITEPMHFSMENGHFDNVPILIGFNSEEIVSRIRSVESVKQGAELADKNPASLIHAKWHIPEKDRLKAGAIFKKLYTSKNFSEDLPAYVAFCSDIFLVEGIIRQADLFSKSVPVYLYQFSYEGSAHHDVDIPGVHGAGHAEDLFYVWIKIDLNSEDLVISKRLLTMWTNFIKDLNPTPTVDQRLGLPVWPRVEPNNLVYLDINTNVTIKSNPKKYLGTKAIFKKFMKAPFDVY